MNEASTTDAKVCDEVRAAIESALARHAAREARDIELNVRDGVVEVSGRVQSAEEKEAVLGAAKRTAGVQLVEDRLAIGF